MSWCGDRRKILTAMGSAALLMGCSKIGQSSGRVLHVQSGQTKRLPARLWRFDSVHIEKGGTLLIVANSQDWLILDVAGDVHLDGRIDFGSFSSDRRIFEATTPSGLRLSHQFSMSNIGGNGGDGGSQGGPLVGGAGAAGTTEHGGGGGSGAVHDAHRRRPGQPAVGRIGAERGTFGAGGDGGRRGNTNGGLMFIGVGGKAIGSGVIDVRGVSGEDGKAGAGGIPRNVGTGGGGGGAPGGEGGVVWVQTPDSRTPGWTFLVDGGRAGIGGPSRGVPGTDGEDGLSGYFLTL